MQLFTLLRFLPGATQSAVIENTLSGPFGTNPQPSTWGGPVAVFDSSATDASCTLLNLQLVVNICLCGDWGSTSNCRPELYRATRGASVL